MVDSERREEVGCARETDETDAIVAHALEKLVDRNFRLGEAVRLHILDFHAAGKVEGDHYIAAYGHLCFDPGIPLGARQRDGKGGDGCEQEPESEPARQRVVALN